MTDVIVGSGFRKDVARSLLQQEEWDLADAKAEFISENGPNSWSYIVEQGHDLAEWRKVQGKEFATTCIHLRSDEGWLKSHFGFFFWRHFSRKPLDAACQCIDCSLEGVSSMFDHGIWELRDQSECRCFECNEVFLSDYLVLLGAEDKGLVCDRYGDCDSDDDEEDGYETAQE